MQVLLTAADTPVGLAVSDCLLDRGHSVVPFDFGSSLWKSARQAERAVKRSGCDLVIDARLQSMLDGGDELSEDDVARLQDLARGCSRQERPFIHLSSASIFDGSSERRYLEADPPDRVTPNSSFLADAEAVIEADAERHIVLRLATVLAGAGRNPLTAMLSQLQSGGAVTFHEDRRGCPVPAHDVARVLAAIVDQLSCDIEPWGCYHYCSSDLTTCYELAEVVLATASQFSKLDDEFVQLQRRGDLARMSRWELNCTKIFHTFGIKQMPWRASVVALVQQIYGRELPDHINPETINEQSI
ncbi:MAG: dTDP-4-dehydrorhamnose reductase [Halieaceae bacterium]|jgi:dTDP-4-dehydrorhamnose reductase